jgi:hypothetical protein
MFARLAAFDFASILEKIKSNEINSSHCRVRACCQEAFDPPIWPVFAAFVPFGDGEALFHFISRGRGSSSINLPTRLFSIDCARTTLKFL